MLSRSNPGRTTEAVSTLQLGPLMGSQVHIVFSVENSIV